MFKQKITIISIIFIILAGIIFTINYNVYINNQSSPVTEYPNTWNNTGQEIQTKNIVSNFDTTITNHETENYPKIKFNKPVSDITLIAEIDFTDKFKEKYSYEEARWYGFALKFFIGNKDNGWFYNTFRKDNRWVGNDSTLWLDWRKPAYLINGGATRYIPLDEKVKVAVPYSSLNSNLRYININMLWYIEENLWERLPIGVYLSSTRELEGRQLTKIKELKIKYYWDPEDIETKIE